MAWMETDYSNALTKWRLEHLGALGIMGETAPFDLARDKSISFVKNRSCVTHLHYKDNSEMHSGCIVTLSCKRLDAARVVCCCCLLLLLFVAVVFGRCLLFVVVVVCCCCCLLVFVVVCCCCFL